MPLVPLEPTTGATVAVAVAVALVVVVVVIAAAGGVVAAVGVAV